MMNDIVKTFGISIIVPIYNAGNYLDECLHSITKQSYELLEIILVNDGSTDNSLDICKEFQKKDDRIKIINQSNQGQNVARKSGLKEASYEFIGFVDSDDWIDETMYESLIKKMIEFDCDIVSSGVTREYESGEAIQRVFDCYDEGFYDDLNKYIYPRMLWNKDTDDFGLYCNLYNKLYKKYILEQVFSSTDTRVFYGEDALVCYTYMLKCKSVYIDKTSYYHYRIHKNSVCRTADERLLHNSFYLYNGLKKVFMESSQCRDVLLRQLKNYILHIEEHVLYQLYDININVPAPIEGYDELIGKKVVIYGAGEYGRLIFRYIKHKGNCEIVAWADAFPKGKENKCHHYIIEPSAINKYEYDYILIAVKSSQMAKDIKNQLMREYDVDEDKILWQEINLESVFKDVYLL